MRIISIFLFHLLIFSQAWAQPKPLKKYVSPDRSFEIGYPANWRVEPNPTMGMAFLVLSVQENEKDSFADNVNLFIQDMKGAVATSEEAGISSKSFLRKMVTEYKELQSNKLKLGNRDAYMIVYTGRQGQYRLQYAQIMLVEKGKCYIFTYTALPASYNTFINSFNQIVASFKSLK